MIKNWRVRQFESQLAVAKTHAKMPPKVAMNMRLEDIKRKYVCWGGNCGTGARRDAVEYGIGDRGMG